MRVLVSQALCLNLWQIRKNCVSVYFYNPRKFGLFKCVCWLYLFLLLRIAFPLASLWCFPGIWCFPSFWWTKSDQLFCLPTLPTLVSSSQPLIGVTNVSGFKTRSLMSWKFPQCWVNQDNRSLCLWPLDLHLDSEDQRPCRVLPALPLCILQTRSLLWTGILLGRLCDSSVNRTQVEG